MFPTLISVSLAPGSYFFCAAAGPAVPIATPSTSAGIRYLCMCIFLPPLDSVASAARFGEPHHDQSNQSGKAGRHQIDEQDQHYTIDRAGEALRYVFGDVGDKQHEPGTEQCACDRADAADHKPNEKRNRKSKGEAIGRHELHDDSAERTSDPSIQGADAEGER